MLKCDLDIVVNQTDVLEVAKQSEASQRHLSNTAGRMFQHPFSSLLESINLSNEEEKHTKGVSKNYKEDEVAGPYYKFVKVRKIYYKGKGIYELKLIQYLFLNQNLPLFNALPCQFLLAQDKSKNELYQDESFSDDEGDFTNDNVQNDQLRIIACGRKRKIVRRK